MLATIYIPFTKSIFDIIVNNNPDDIEGLSDKDYDILYIEYTKKLETQYMLEAHNWVNKYINSEAIIINAINSGSEEVEFQVQLD